MHCLFLGEIQFQGSTGEHPSAAEITGLALETVRYHFAARDAIFENQVIPISDSSSSQIVTKESCTIGVSVENVIPLPANHFNMCRIKSRDDQAYQRVLWHCQEIGAKASQKHTV